MSTLIHHPIVTEKAMDEMDFDNKLQFIVDVDAPKGEIVTEIENRYDISIVKINTQVTPKGKKKATVTLSEADNATDIASRIGVF